MSKNALDYLSNKYSGGGSSPTVVSSGSAGDYLSQKYNNTLLNSSSTSNTAPKSYGELLAARKAQAEGTSLDTTELSTTTVGKTNQSTVNSLNGFANDEIDTRTGWQKFWDWKNNGGGFSLQKNEDGKLKLVAGKTQEQKLHDLDIQQKIGVGSKAQTGTNFGNRTAANYDASFVQQQQAIAWNAVAKNPSADNIAYAQKLDEYAATVAENDATALNAKGGLISKDLASYAPQLEGQIARQALPTLIGIGTGSKFITKAGAVVGSGTYSYDTMRGISYKSLLDAGADHTIASKASEDEAKISSGIEMLETAISVSVGVGKDLTNALAGKAAKKAVADEATRTAFKAVAEELAKYGLNIGTEGFEEAAQQLVSVANQLRIEDGKGDGGMGELISYFGKAADLAYGSGRNTEAGQQAREEIKEAAAGGARLAMVLGLAEIGAGHTMQKINTNALTNSSKATIEETHDFTPKPQPKAALDIVLDDNKENYSKAATEILHDEELLAAYTERYGEPVGKSETEKAKNIAKRMWDITHPKKQQGTVIVGGEKVETAEAPKVVNETGTDVGAVMRIREMSNEGINFKAAAEIATDPQLRAAFEDMYGVTLPENKNKAKQMIFDIASETRLSDAVTPSGEDLESYVPQHQPNSVNATVTETRFTPAESYVRGLLMSEDTKEIIGNPEYEQAFTSLTGMEATPENLEIVKGVDIGKLTKNGSLMSDYENGKTDSRTPDWRHQKPYHPKTHNKLNETVSEGGKHEIGADYEGAHAKSTEETTSASAPEYTLRDEQTENTTDKNAPKSTQESKRSRQGISVPPEPQNAHTAQNDEFNLKPEAENRQNAPQTPSNVGTNHPEETYSGDTAPTKDTYAEGMSDELYEETGGQKVHEVHHDVEVNDYADQRIAKDPEQARAELLSAKEGSWSDVDTCTARKLMDVEVANIENAQTEAEKVAAINRLAELRDAYEKQGSENARAMRQRRAFSGTKTDIISDAVNTLKNENGLKRTLNKVGKDNLLSKISDYATRLENLGEGDTQALVALIRDVSETRRTTSLFNTENGQIINNIIDKVLAQEGGEEFLKNLATTQIRSIAGDYTKIKPIDYLKGIRYLFALSNPKTANTNVGANTVFGEAISVLNNDMALPFDMLFSAITGQRTIAFDRGLLSGDTWKGADDALLRSILEVTLDAEADQATYAYNEIKGNTFKMTGNWAERLLATMAKWQGYALKSTDQMAKGGVEAELERGLNKLNEKNGNKLTKAGIEETAKEEAKYRTLQTNSKVANKLNALKDWLNGFHIGNKKTGTYGLGDHFIMFAQVPANQVVTQLQMQPAVGGVEALVNLGKLINEASNGEVTVEQQRKTAKAFGRAVTGAGMIAASMYLCAAGCIRCVDEDDDDLAAMLKAEGKNGTQWNIDATRRLLFGGDSRPQEGDKWISMNWIPQINSLMITGNSMYHSKIDDGTLTANEIYVSVGKGLIDSLKDFPAVSGVASTIKSASYAKYNGEDRDELSETDKKVADAKAKAGAVLGNEIGNFISGITVPNALRGIATGLDDTERDTYASNNPFDRAKDYWKSGIPGLRETIQPRVDGFGNVVKNEGGAIQFFNKTILPGAISHDRATQAQSMVEGIVARTGDTSIVPDKNAPSSVKFGDQTVVLTPEEDTAYQTLRGQVIDMLYDDFENSDIYEVLSDDQRIDVMKSLKQSANLNAKAELAKSRGIEYTNDELTLINGVDKPGTSNDVPGLGADNIVEYTIFKTVLKGAVNTSNYDDIDLAMAYYDSLNGTIKAVAKKKGITDLGLLSTYREAGYNAETAYMVDNSITDTQYKYDKSSASGATIKLLGLAELSNDKMSDAEKGNLIESGALDLSKTGMSLYNVLRAHNFTVKEIADFFYNADYTTKDGVETNKSQDGSLSNLEVAAALDKIPESRLSFKEKEQIYNELRAELSNSYKVNDWGRYSYGSEVNYLTKSAAKGYRNGRE